MAETDPSSAKAFADLIFGTERRYAVHVGSVPVVETFQCGTVWDGIVEVFRLVGHRSLARSYAWTEPDEESWSAAHVPPVDSLLEAIKASIVGRAQDPDYPGSPQLAERPQSKIGHYRYHQVHSRAPARH